MIYLKCPACGEFEPVPDFTHLPTQELRVEALDGTPSLEAFVHEHLGHLEDDELLDVLEYPNDCN